MPVRTAPGQALLNRKPAARRAAYARADGAGASRKNDKNAKKTVKKQQKTVKNALKTGKKRIKNKTAAKEGAA